ncbi:hypothetical protein VF21_09556 [Pseudogymnoascus sp. 05NY08]|nr:hypothetical protein VF21_09556 [Pseudogymnoascus sp. 05NY08]
MSINIEYKGKFAIITIDNPTKANAISHDNFYRLAACMRAAAANDDVKVTLLRATGRHFSAGAELGQSREAPAGEDRRKYFLRHVAAILELGNSFYTHPKILVTALNGPVIGITAAIIAHSDFIYAMPHAYLLAPFSSLGLVAEGGSSRAFVQRMGISKANEALIMSKRMSAAELLQCGFVNQIFDTEGSVEKFVNVVTKEVEDRFGDHLNGDSLVKIKALIKGPERDTMDGQVLKEILGGVERMMSGAPQVEFAKMASGQKKHRL